MILGHVGGFGRIPRFLEGIIRTPGFGGVMFAREKTPYVVGVWTRAQRGYVDQNVDGPSEFSLGIK